MQTIHSHPLIQRQFQQGDGDPACGEPRMVSIWYKPTTTRSIIPFSKQLCQVVWAKAMSVCAIQNGKKQNYKIGNIWAGSLLILVLNWYDYAKRYLLNMDGTQSTRPIDFPTKMNHNPPYVQFILWCLFGYGGTWTNGQRFLLVHLMSPWFSTLAEGNQVILSQTAIWESFSETVPSHWSQGTFPGICKRCLKRYGFPWFSFRCPMKKRHKTVLDHQSPEGRTAPSPVSSLGPRPSNASRKWTAGSCGKETNKRRGSMWSLRIWSSGGI